MSTVGVRELKNRLTHYLSQAKKGEEVIITELNKPIALLQRIGSVADPVSVEARLAKMAADGEVELPAGEPLRRLRRVRIKGKPLSQTIIEDREDR